MMTPDTAELPVPRRFREEGFGVLGVSLTRRLPCAQW